MPDGRVANWIISSHDEKRIMSRKCLMTLILPWNRFYKKLTYAYE